MEILNTKYQRHYWEELYELKVHTVYMEILLEHDEKWDRFINIFLAIASSGSIGSWIIWKTYGFIWASIIVLSQVLNAIRPFLPYKNRLKALFRALPEVQRLLNFAESRWYDVSEGNFSEKEIHKLRFEIKNKKTQILNRYFSNGTIPYKKRISKKAHEIAEFYINRFYYAG